MQLGIYLGVVAIVALIFLLQSYEDRKSRKENRKWLKSIFGTKPDRSKGYDLKNEEDISIYYNLIKDGIPEDELVDEITWNDLDMNRIFSRLNTTQSFTGEQVLFCELHRLPKDKGELEIRENIIEFYRANEEQRVEAQFLLQKLFKDKANYWLPEYMDNLEMQRSPFVWVCRILQISLLALVLLALITTNLFLIGAAVANFLINIALYALGKSRYEFFMEALSGIIYTVKTAKSLSTTEVADYYNDRINVKENVGKLNKVSKMIGALVRKRQLSISGDLMGIVSDYMKGALLWDFIVYDKVIRQLIGKQNEFMELYRFVGVIDLCIAIASFRASLGGEYCIPEFDARELVMEEVCHPLIEDAVGNSLDMKRNILLTGSNASGKSTFVKAVAVNVILGQSIHTCTARRMVIPNAGVLTSMAVRDDVLSGESYYMKEIKYLKRMIDRTNGERMVICGIDEILRGTNTVERLAASISILNYLSDKNCLIMVASHDLELAKSLKDKYENLYFTEALEDGDVVFDYKLRKGISNTRNAIQLLHAVGFPEEIVTDARKLSALELDVA